MRYPAPMSSRPADPAGWQSQVALFPATRYQGSKRKLLPWILDCLADLPFSTALDAFSGTGAVAYGLKALGKAVTACDQLESNRRVAEALVANDDQVLAPEGAEELLRPRADRDYGSFIADTFEGIYYPADENGQLDVIAGNLAAMPPGPQRALASFALFQACLVKRPFNLFHRRNLSLRTADVERSFGNKTTWERPFAELLPRFAAEAAAAVFAGQRRCRALACDILQAPGSYDLVYLDPPYVPARGEGPDYRAYYHFLEGLCDLAGWPARVDLSTRNRRLRGVRSPWGDARRIRELLVTLYRRHPHAKLVLSYRSDGVPDPDELAADLRAIRGELTVHDAGTYRYALSTNRRSRELLFVAY
ncbi:MAG: DNA adenine methylase [Myxococcota bacterium]|nr:DNA adenine methylase [Myxococcota bacterium]